MLVLVGGIHSKTTVCRGNIEGSTETMKQSNCCWYTFIYAVNTNKPHISGNYVVSSTTLSKAETSVGISEHIFMELFSKQNHYSHISTCKGQ